MNIRKNGVLMIFFLAMIPFACQEEPNKAEELLAEELQKVQLEASPCMQASTWSKTPRKISQAITTCIEKSHIGPYALQFSIEEHPPKIILKSTIGVQPILSSEIEKECIHDLISSFPSTTSVPKMESQMYPSHDIQLVRESSGRTPRYKTSGCAISYTSEQTHTALTPIKDHIYEVGIPWKSHKVGAALLACDTTFLSSMPAEPMLFSIELTLPPEPAERGQCKPHDKKSEYQGCICAAMLDHFQRRIAPKINTLSIEMTDKDGKTHISEQKTQPPQEPEIRALWIYRQTSPTLQYQYLQQLSKAQRNTL